MRDEISNSGAGQGGAKRRRDQDFDRTLAALASPERARVLDQLLLPLVRQRRFRAPDVGFALAALADSPVARGLDDQALGEALAWLKAERGEVVKPSDVETAIARAEPASTARRRWIASRDRNRDANPPELFATWLTVLERLRRRLTPEVVASWIEPLMLLGVERGELVLGTPSPIVKDRVDRLYRVDIEGAAQAAGLDVSWVEVRMIAREATDAA